MFGKKNYTIEPTLAKEEVLIQISEPTLIQISVSRELSKKARNTPLHRLKKKKRSSPDFMNTLTKQRLLKQPALPKDIPFTDATVDMNIKTPIRRQSITPSRWTKESNPPVPRTATKRKPARSVARALRISSPHLDINSPNGQKRSIQLAPRMAKLNANAQDADTSRRNRSQKQVINTVHGLRKQTEHKPAIVPIAVKPKQEITQHTTIINPTPHKRRTLPLSIHGRCFYSVHSVASGAYINLRKRRLEKVYYTSLQAVFSTQDGSLTQSNTTEMQSLVVKTTPKRTLMAK